VLPELASLPEVDVVLNAVVGFAGLPVTLWALEHGVDLALANKESLVAAGDLALAARERGGGRLLPVDSEHSAAFQCLDGWTPEQVDSLVLTASGGPFRGRSRDEIADVTADEALAHPTWNMGPKITIDSATMMNKALEIIEAHWLFGLRSEQIHVLLHRQSMVHSLVEFVDGSIVAQLGPPDMKLPIQYALEYPNRQPGIAERLDWQAPWRLDFEPPDPERFPALELGHLCARKGGTSGAVLNAANEAAVESFLEGELHFTEIVPACRSVLDSHDFDEHPTLDRLIELDRWARQEVSRWVCA
jgi:1-deoxy-D-xylulose-5-phosphate reductoisomerase